MFTYDWATEATETDLILSCCLKRLERLEPFQHTTFNKSQFCTKKGNGCLRTDPECRNNQCQTNFNSTTAEWTLREREGEGERQTNRQTEPERQKVSNRILSSSQPLRVTSGREGKRSTKSTQRERERESIEVQSQYSNRGSLSKSASPSKCLALIAVKAL